MRWITDLLFRLRAIFAWGKMQEELDEEMAFHLEMETKKLVESGMPEVEEGWRLDSLWRSEGRSQGCPQVLDGYAMQPRSWNLAAGTCLELGGAGTD